MVKRLETYIHPPLIGAEDIRSVFVVFRGLSVPQRDHTEFIESQAPGVSFRRAVRHLCEANYMYVK